MEAFSTIVSPVFSELVIIIEAGIVASLPSEVSLFETLCTMNGFMPFKLVFLLVHSDLPPEEARRNMAYSLDPAIGSGLLDFLDSPPTIRGAHLRGQGKDRFIL